MPATASTFRFNDPDAELFAKLAEFDRVAAPIFAKRTGSWVPADWSTSNHGFTGNSFRSWDEEDAA
jgi:hypothetical protein